MTQLIRRSYSFFFILKSLKLIEGLKTIIIDCCFQVMIRLQLMNKPYQSCIETKDLHDNVINVKYNKFIIFLNSNKLYLNFHK